MLFNTWLYAYFLTVAFAGYWLSYASFKPYWLILCGIVFYTQYRAVHIVLILGLALFTFAMGRMIAPDARSRSRAGLVFGLVVTLGALAYYKYQGFFVDLYAAAAGLIVPVDELSRPQLVPPLAISFFTFEFVHYLIEVYRGNVRASLRDFLLFIMFFPTLVAGPIKRYPNFERYLDFTRKLDWSNVDYGLRRILFGLTKKIVIADTTAQLTAPIWQNPSGYDATLLWLASYGYAVQIYMDFSGYSDIAIGSAKLFGFTVEENFNYPYLRRNIRDFWRSWHMSLTSWITDYLYIPLGGNRKGRRRADVNTLVAMGLCGLWHGAALHFVAWGLYHGAALTVHRAYGRWRDAAFPNHRRFLALPRAVISTLFTFHVVVVGWVFFILDIRPATVVVCRMLGLAD